MNEIILAAIQNSELDCADWDKAVQEELADDIADALLAYLTIVIGKVVKEVAAVL
jgi:hypothetical protein